MSIPLRTNDPAYGLLEHGLKNPEFRSITTVYNSNCYICRDPEFALMGMPLCYPCVKCKGHVPADDIKCTDCGFEHDF